MGRREKKNSGEQIMPREMPVALRPRKGLRPACFFLRRAATRGPRAWPARADTAAGRTTDVDEQNVQTRAHQFAEAPPLGIQLAISDLHTD